MDTPSSALNVFKKHSEASGFATLEGRTVLEGFLHLSTYHLAKVPCALIPHTEAGFSEKLLLGCPRLPTRKRSMALPFKDIPPNELMVMEVHAILRPLP